MEQYVLETSDLTKTYGNYSAVDGVSLKVPQCSIYGFLGANGAGKSTTMKMVLGLIKPDRGSIRVFGRPFPQERTRILRRVGALIESPSYYGHLTGYQNLRIVAKLMDVSESQIMETLEWVRLENQADKKVKHYSLGMKQRLGIAMAIVHRPKLLILDEPTNGLDPSGIQEIRSFIKSIPEKFGMTVLISSHLLHEIEQIAEHVGIIHEGQLIYQDTLASLQEKGGDLPLERIFLEMTGQGRSL
ncbi:ABC transporter ATP-binding protein [Paenibacillus senegalensis]|uniref:ABC transporter ATP-binding protein n=1 Tax=Paenibacillus senegalensis TaxID=1465766 RepID=UPI000288AD06|nr:ABC transporter ATP-binding protein [Paenibacillus senegalensis]